MLYLERETQEHAQARILDTSANRQIGEFVLDVQLGASDAATVFRAFQPNVNRYVALKVINLPSETGGSVLIFERRFTQEAQVLAGLEHPHIVPIYHYGVVENQCAYIAMRLMHGSLKEVLAEAPLPSERVIDITTQLIAGLGYAHSKGMIHLDIKPENVLFDDAGSACLTDFGLVRASGQMLDTTKPTALKYAMLYTSPEQINSDSADNRADIYSLGVLMYQMLTGRVPFDEQDIGLRELLNRIEVEEPVPPRQINPNIHPELERIILQALRKEPRERFFDVQELGQALARVPGTRMGGRRALPRPARLRPPINAAWRRIFKVGFVLLQIIIALGFIRLVYDLAQAPTPLPNATIITGVQGNVESSVPSAAEVEQARRRIGERGFIAYIACSMASAFESDRVGDMSGFASSYGIPLQVYDSSGDSYKQLTLIEQARMAGAQAIILCPLQPSVLADSLTSVRSANIPVILTDRLPNSFGGVMIEQDNPEIGRMAGRYVGESLAAAGNKQPNVLILDEPTYSFSKARAEGFIQGLHERLPNAQIVGPLPGGANAAASQAALTNFLRSEQSIDAVFSVTDSGAYGAISALSAAGFEPDSVIVVSVNAENQALDEIRSGRYLRATVDLERAKGSLGALDAAIKLLGNGTVPEIIISPSGNLITRDIIGEPPPPSNSS
jgi:ABC-type sugar transport system substrate-binding protein